MIRKMGSIRHAIMVVWFEHRMLCFTGETAPDKLNIASGKFYRTKITKFILRVI